MPHTPTITKDVANKTIRITRTFDAPREKVWRAWTESSLLDRWWAPKPWRAETKSMDFRDGGLWLYSMVGPDNERHWARVDYKTIQAPERFTAVDAFCNEEGTPNPDLPAMTWQVEFLGANSQSSVEVTITFENEADLEHIVEMGFAEGFTMALGNLDEVLRGPES